MNYHFQMVVKMKENLEKTRDVKINDKSEKNILRGERNVRCHDRFLSKFRERKQKNLKKNSTGLLVLSQ